MLFWAMARISYGQVVVGLMDRVGVNSVCDYASPSLALQFLLVVVDSGANEHQAMQKAKKYNPCGFAAAFSHP
jgi:hypothetical protein